jgi:hypothetical protein
MGNDSLPISEFNSGQNNILVYDSNKNGFVDEQDVALVNSKWITRETPPITADSYNARGDLVSYNDPKYAELRKDTLARLTRRTAEDAERTLRNKLIESAYGITLGKPRTPLRGCKENYSVNRKNQFMGDVTAQTKSCRFTKMELSDAVRQLLEVEPKIFPDVTTTPEVIAALAHYHWSVDKALTLNPPSSLSKAPIKCLGDVKVGYTKAVSFKIVSPGMLEVKMVKEDDQQLTVMVNLKNGEIYRGVSTEARP